MSLKSSAPTIISYLDYNKGPLTGPSAFILSPFQSVPHKLILNSITFPRFNPDYEVMLRVHQGLLSISSTNSSDDPPDTALPP